MPHSALGRIERTLRGEVGRRLVHASGTGLPVLYLLTDSWELVATLYVVCAVGVVLLDVARLYGGLHLWLYEHLTREYEQEKFAGYVLYMVSSAAVWLAFAPEIAIPAILMLTLVDPISGTISPNELRRYKRPSVLVVIFLLCVALTAPFHYTVPLAVFLGGLGGTLADGVTLRIGEYIVDDNLTIPIFAAVGIQIGVAVGPLL